MGLPTLLLNKPVDFLCVFIQCHFQFPIQQILCQFKITPIHRRNFSALPDTLFFPVAGNFNRNLVRITGFYTIGSLP